MIELKTSGKPWRQTANRINTWRIGERNQHLLYDLEKTGIAFQVRDDYLDACDPAPAKPGGDILANKKTFLLIHALEAAGASAGKELDILLKGDERKIGKGAVGITRQMNGRCSQK